MTSSIQLIVVRERCADCGVESDDGHLLGHGRDHEVLDIEVELLIEGQPDGDGVELTNVEDTRTGAYYTGLLTEAELDSAKAELRAAMVQENFDSRVDDAGYGARR